MIDRRFLLYAFDLRDLPPLACPDCGLGTLVAREKQVPIEPKYAEISNPDRNPEEMEFRLAGKLVCSNDTCGQLVVFSADGGVEWGAGHDGQGDWVEYWKLKAIHPAPHIIQVPANLPQSIRAPLIAAFETFWNQKGLSANATRQVIERLLDHHDVPRFNAERRRLSLAARIQRLSEINGEYGELFDLFRPFLNAGSHGDPFDAEILVDVFEALEIHIGMVFDLREERLTELRDKLKGLRE